MPLRVVMLGDIVGSPGRLAVMQQIPVIRQRWKPDLILANGENAAAGSGLTPEQYHKLRAAGLDGITLGDHVYKRDQIVPVLETEQQIIRPANLPTLAKGRSWMRLTPASTPGSAPTPLPNLYVLTVLGRIFSSLPADDPFAAVDRILPELPERDPIVLVEVHAETTSEKQALGWYLDGRVAAVVGTHTHVPTADAKILPHGTGYITDLGMSGPYESVLGRRIDRVLTHMTTAMHAPFDVADGDPRVCGVYLEIDPASRRTTHIERIELKADPHARPFVA
ncbi:MAG: YmdB family metallophosphoesterase [Phycisphaeraceae bacterium]|nr:YmdB family metallophosphoesterase [Phycisphaeraceae bacterium]